MRKVALTALTAAAMLGGVAIATAQDSATTGKAATTGNTSGTNTGGGMGAGAAGGSGQIGPGVTAPMSGGVSPSNAPGTPPSATTSGNAGVVPAK